MKAVIQRVSRASVEVDDDIVGSVGEGMVILLGILRGDGSLQARRLAERIARFRFFTDEEGRMNLSVLDTGRAALVVSQFTLAADGRSGRRPSFDQAALPDVAEPLYEEFVAHMEGLGVPCETGCFGARMQLEISNDGPVTFVLDEEAPE